MDRLIRVSMKNAASCVIYHELQTLRVVKFWTHSVVGFSLRHIWFRVVIKISTTVVFFVWVQYTRIVCACLRLRLLVERYSSSSSSSSMSIPVSVKNNEITAKWCNSYVFSYTNYVICANICVFVLCMLVLSLRQFLSSSSLMSIEIFNGYRWEDVVVIDEWMNDDDDDDVDMCCCLVMIWLDTLVDKFKRVHTFYLLQTQPELRCDYPLNLSISLSGGKETN